jgi:prepilin-type N-terminal cleavage/methylation domain-containing protein
MQTAAERKTNRYHGFTLIELSVVIVILLLLAALVMPNLYVLRHSRALYDMEAAIARIPQDAGSEARRSHLPVRVRIEGDAFILERIPEAQTDDPVTFQRTAFSSEIRVERARLGQEDRDTATWQWTVYPDGSAESGGLEFTVGAARRALALYRDGKSQWLTGNLPDTSEEQWPAGEIERRG